MNEHIEALIAKKLSQGLDAGEEEELAAWLKEPENKHVFDEFRKAWEISGETLVSSDWDVDAEWEEFKKLQQHQPRKPSLITPSSVWWTATAAAAIILAVIIIGPFKSHEVSILARNAGEVVPLPDGSTIRLNKDAVLSYQKGFNKNHRQVQLDGEAFFEVEKSVHPFEIITPGCTTRIVGTAFNLRTVNGETSLYVSEGIVAFHAGTKGEIQVHPNQQALFVEGKGIVAFDTIANENSIAWMSHKLTFYNQSLQKVLEDVGRYYGKKVAVSPSVSDRQFTGSFESAQLNDLLEVVTLSTNTTYALRNDSILIAN